VYGDDVSLEGDTRVVAALVRDMKDAPDVVAVFMLPPVCVCVYTCMYVCMCMYSCLIHVVRLCVHVVAVSLEGDTRVVVALVREMKDAPDDVVVFMLPSVCVCVYMYICMHMYSCIIHVCSCFVAFILPPVHVYECM
jgi:hypothetical protein